MLDLTIGNIRKSWKKIYLSKPSKKRRFSRGEDGVTIEDFKKDEDTFLQEIFEKVNRQPTGGFFVFDKLHTFEKPRKGKKPRQIQAPTVRDRIIQKLLNEHLIKNHFKVIFQKYGIVGSVEGTIVKNVILDLVKFYNQGYVYVLKTDIKDYFPSINPKRLKKIYKYFIKEKDVNYFLEGFIKQSDKSGIPQGSPLSSTMANLYLIALDKYLSQRKTIKHIRYVDDILIFCKSQKEAVKFYNYLLKYFTKVKLHIHPLADNTKTKIDGFDSGKIDALGVIFRKGQLLIKPDKVNKFINEVVNPIKRPSYILSFKGRIPAEKLNEFCKVHNYKVTGWANTYRFCDVSKLYERLDIAITSNFKSVLKQLKGLSDDEKKEALESLAKLSSSMAS